MYSALADVILGLHLLFILWIVFGATVTRRRPVLQWLHLGSLVWGILIEILPWTCPLTWAENWLEARAGVAPYQGGFILHYLDALVYPNIPPSLLTGCGIGICVINLSNADGSLVGRSPERNKWTGSTQPNENSRHAADTQSEVEREASAGLRNP